MSRMSGVPTGTRRLAAFARATLRLLTVTLMTAASLLPAMAARATIAPDAKPVLDRFLQALGGRAEVDKVRSFYEKGSLQAFGLKGAAEIWSQRPDRTASVISIGPIIIKDGWDGAVAWRTDPSGKLVFRDGKDLDDAKSDAWFANDRWLEPDQAGGVVKSLGTEKDSTGSYAVLEVTPPIGRSRKLYFDAGTGLLARSVSRRDQNTVVNTISDYRRVGGIQHSFRQAVHIVELPANDATIVVDSVALNPEIPPARFSPPVDGAAPVRWLGAPGIAKLPFDYSARHVWLRASVNGGPPEDFLFDTGASITVLDSAWAAAHGIKTEGRQQGMGAGASGGASFARLDSIAVRGPDGDGVALRDLRIAVLSINSVLAPYFWKSSAGVLGYDFISRFVTEIDFDGKTLVLRESKGYQHQGAGTAVPMTLAGTTPVIEMTLDGKWTGKFRVDVGSGSTLDLHTPFVQKNGLQRLSGRTLEVMGGGFGGTFTTTMRRMKSVRIGALSVPGPLVGLSHATVGGFASEDYAGNAGNRLLDRFKVTLDYERRTLWLEPGRRYKDPDVFPRAGVQLAKMDGEVRAAMVLAGSPAATAGVKEGDVVLSIDGTPAAEWDPERVSDALDQGAVGSRHTLEVQRGGGNRTLTLTLKELL